MEFDLDEKNAERSSTRPKYWENIVILLLYKMTTRVEENAHNGRRPSNVKTQTVSHFQI